MRFLVVTKPKHPAPPEMVLGLADAMTPWINKYTGNKKIEQAWGFAGIAGGFGIANVNSFEELDAIMMEFPFGPLSEIEIYPLVDVLGSVQRMKQAIQAMMPPARG